VSSLSGRRVVLGVGGGIAAYKAAELVRLLGATGASVRCVLTAAGARFITPLTLQALSGHPVGQELFSLTEESQIGHIRLADEADLLVIAPATADLLARLATGQADDLLTTVALATRAPLVLAPAMNVQMWESPLTQDNVRRLQLLRGAHLLGPASGELACGWVGQGRLLEPAAIVESLERLCDRGGSTRCAGQRWLVTAGPTHEALDPVRFLGNRSSGKMGYAVAGAAAAAGAQVVLVSGPSALDCPRGVERISVTGALELHRAVMERYDSSDVIVMAAAVADYRPATPSPTKLAGRTPPDPVALVANPDILAELGQRRAQSGQPRPLLVGFAAEVGPVDEHTPGADRVRRKLEAKGCDLLVANDVTEDGAGFEVDTNRVVLFGNKGPPQSWPRGTKEQLAIRLVAELAVFTERLEGRG
jgi:phosphopantothenoylcysteine decarboxylase/phosphopantothenate--cysteine ligase